MNQLDLIHSTEKERGGKFQRKEKFSELAVLASSLIIRFFGAISNFAEVDPYHIKYLRQIYS